MAASISKSFIDEAESLLTAIRGTVLVHLQDGVRPEHLKVARDSARILHSLAAEADDDAVFVAAETLQIWLTMLASDDEPLSPPRARRLLDQISEVEVTLLAHKARHLNEPIEVSDFIEESFRNLEPDAAEEQDIEVEAMAVDAFEIDGDMLEVFRQEAEGLLDSIRTNLNALSEREDNRDAIWNIKKAAHTFKGASGIVGLHASSKLAHRIEDVLETLTGRTDFTDPQILNVLANATQLLTLLSNGESSAHLEPQLMQIEVDLGNLLASPSPPRSEASVPTPTNGFPNTPSDDATSRRPLRGGSIVRVSLERFDDLVNIIRDLVTSRSAFQSKIDELSNQVQESGNYTLRLQAASAKIRRIDGSVDLGDIQQTAYELGEAARDALVINSSLSEIRTGFEDVFVHQRGLIESIQGRLIRLRNVEFGSIATRLQRAVRVTCDEEQKEAEVEVENGTVEVDTQVIDLLIEPLMHLLKNAVVHGIESPETRRILGKPEVGKIVVRVSADGPNLLLTVADDGAGIMFQRLLQKAIARGIVNEEEAESMSKSQIQELIFHEGLTTAETVNLNAGRGVGMGIIRESLIAAGGTVSFETWPQKGTTFRIRLPLPFADLGLRDRLRSRLNVNLPSDELSVLVVDDSPSVRLMTSRSLHNAGWQVHLAINGIDALEKLTGIDPLPTIILSDIEMPRMGGYEFLAALRDDPKLRGIPVVFISSRTGAEDREHALSAGAIEYFTKPYKEADLITFLERFACGEQR